jgi:hypothetical protein
VAWCLVLVFDDEQFVTEMTSSYSFPYPFLLRWLAPTIDTIGTIELATALLVAVLMVKEYHALLPQSLAPV